MNDKDNQQERVRKLLIVEDFEDNRFMLSRLLEMSGFQVMGAANGAEALEVLRKEFPDLILTDLIMPLVNGLELIQQLKRNEKTSSIPVIAISAGEKALLDEARTIGASSVHQKPIHFERLLVSIESLLRTTSPSESLTEDKPDDNLILTVRKSIVIVNEQLSDFFRNDPEELRRIDPFKFESVVAELFKEEGYEVVITPARADGGKDLYIYKKDPLTEVMFLEAVS